MQVRQATTRDNWVTVLSARQMIGGELGDLRIAVFNVAGRFYATANVCTHQFAPLTDGWLSEPVVECPLHGGQFDVTCGRALGGIVDCDFQTNAIREVDGVLQVNV